MKIDVGSCVIRNTERYKNSRTLVVTGERAEESAARAKYATFEPDRADGRDTRHKRHIDHWRPVHAWSEEQVWEIIQRHNVLVHPAYRLGWSRLSCMSCIFGNKDQWASVKEISQKKFETIAKYEEQFGVTIHRSKSVREQADAGKAYEDIIPELVEVAMSKKYNEPITINPSDWQLPAGAYREGGGPL